MKRLFIGLILAIVSLAPAGAWVHGSNAYFGLVATRGMVENSVYTGYSYIQTRTAHFARTAFSQAELILSNATGIDSGGPGVSSVDTCSIEYPANTFTQCTFSSATSVTIPSGSLATTDLLTLTTPIPNGATFWVRIYHYISNGHIALNSGSAGLDATTFSATPISDQTMGGTVVQTNTSLDLFPVAILGYTTAPSLCLFGDSRVSGSTTDTVNNTNGDIGEYARTIGPSFAYTNLGSSGTHVSNVVSGHINLLAVGAYCSHFIANWSINDVNGGRTAAQILADNQTVRALFPSNKPYWLTTIAPYTTSTDSWATLVNQTVGTYESNRVAYNTTLRAGGISGIAGVFDVGSIVESSLNSGLWPVNGTAYYYTGPVGQGLHENAASYIAIQTSGIITTSSFHIP